MSWPFFSGSEFADPQEAQRALEQLVEERDGLQKSVVDLEKLVEDQKKEITGLEEQVGTAQQSAARIIEQSRAQMQAAEEKENDLNAVRRRLQVAISVCELGTDFRQIAQGMEAVRSGLFPPPLVISGPSGVGKASLISLLMERHGECLRIPVSHTTRKRQEGEVDGVHFAFVERKEMEAAIKEGSFVEVADVDGDLYGTSKQAINDVRNEGHVAVLHIDIAGLEQLQASRLAPV
eukprot:CAMPEP_0181299604 /NCGR_PEP_ID=MMETSP1101-20121128/6438_1 /TAXON_ID=46948 /ORGANISM="Rhodomonas abbreviata, Strain Caron Lab Isolate" /LENGTH=234 /DNA_ID=CAMNT_0023404771 /DNA_START=153 /DNA_END=853 /DNA_ORIENTATION=+